MTDKTTTWHNWHLSQKSLSSNNFKELLKSQWILTELKKEAWVFFITYAKHWEPPSEVSSSQLFPVPEYHEKN